MCLTSKTNRSTLWEGFTTRTGQLAVSSAALGRWHAIRTTLPFRETQGRAASTRGPILKCHFALITVVTRAIGASRSIFRTELTTWAAEAAPWPRPTGSWESMWPSPEGLVLSK